MGRRFQGIIITKEEGEVINMTERKMNRCERCKKTVSRCDNCKCVMRLNHELTCYDKKKHYCGIRCAKVGVGLHKTHVERIMTTKYVGFFVE